MLTWSAPKGARRLTVYAVPDDVARAEAYDEEGDGVDGAFLIGVTYEPRMEVGDAKGYRYAVCVYSGYSTEGEPAWIEP